MRKCCDIYRICINIKNNIILDNMQHKSAAYCVILRNVQKSVIGK